MTVYATGPIPGHSRYLVELPRAHDCPSVFDQPGIPRVGAFHCGKFVIGVNATWLGRGLYLVEVETCEPEVVTESAAAPDATCTLSICEVKRG